MTKNNFLHIRLTTKEISWGIRYLLFQIVFLPTFLDTLNWILPFSLNATQQNFLFFCTNFTAALLIFRRYLLQFLQPDMPEALRIGGFSLLFFGIYWGATTLLTKAFSVIDPDFVNLNDQTIINMTESHYWLMFIGTVFLAPVAEECFHRGLIFRGLYSRSAVLAFLVSTALFSAIHVVQYVGVLSPLTLILSFLQYVPAGLCLAGAYRLSGSLICPILIHMAVNAMGMLALR